MVLRGCFSPAEMEKVSRNCTEDGWSEPFPHYFDVCFFYENITKPVRQHSLGLNPVACLYKDTGITLFLQHQDMYYASVKALYTVGYSTSLVSLTTAMVILCRFR